MSEAEQNRLVNLFATVGWQQIERIPDDRLMDAAQERAFDMAMSDYFDHVDPSGVWPNQRVRVFGYLLPDSYPDDANQVESIAAGYLTPEEALTALYLSEAHHEHVTGQGFWSDHNYFGVGHCHVDDSKFRHYYVIITAPEQTGTAVLPAANEHVIYLPKVEKWIINP